MRLTAGELNRATLARQLLLDRSALSVADAVRRVVALQAQQPASPYVALWNRLAGFDPAGLDAAFAGHQVVRAQLMRITMHAVCAEDHQAFRQAMEPTLRASRLGDPRFTACGLTLGEADVLTGGLLDFAGQPRTNAECEAWLADRLGAPMPPLAWRMLRNPGARAVPGRPRTGGLPPLSPLVGQAARRADPAAPRSLTSASASGSVDIGWRCTRVLD